MKYEVKIREVGPMTAMTTRFITSMDHMSFDMPRAYQHLWDYIESKGSHWAGECFALYHDEQYDPKRIDVECGFSIKEFLPETDRIKARTIEGGTMASTVHKGPYAQMEGAYHAVVNWVNANGYILLPLMRELYLNDPAKVAPEEILTEILWPVKKK